MDLLNGWVGWVLVRYLSRAAPDTACSQLCGINLLGRIFLMLFGGNNTPWAAPSCCSHRSAAGAALKTRAIPVSAQELLVPLLFPHFLLQKSPSVPPRRATRLSIGCGTAAAFGMALEKVQEGSLRVSPRCLTALWVTCAILPCPVPQED